MAVPGKRASVAVPGWRDEVRAANLELAKGSGAELLVLLAAFAGMFTAAWLLG